MEWESGTVYQTLGAPVWWYSTQGRPWGSRYQHPVVKSMPTWSVGTVTPITGPIDLSRDLNGVGIRTLFQYNFLKGYFKVFE